MRPTSSRAVSRPSRSHQHVPGDGVLADVVAELGEFGGDTTPAPHRVLRCHPLDQRDDFATDRRTPGTPRLVGPEARESTTVPTDDGGWLHERKRVGPPRPDPREHDPECSVERAQLRP
jgi:hypothetical protein